MTQLSKLQAKMGGPAGRLDRAAMLRAAEQNLAAVAPRIDAALLEQRSLLVIALSQEQLPLQDLFSAAHQIRGMAGSIGRPSVGAFADVLATYITECADAGLVCADVALRTLAKALDRSFDQAENDAAVFETLTAAKRLATLLGAQKRSVAAAPARSD